MILCQIGSHDNWKGQISGYLSVNLFELICPDQGMGSNSCCRSIKTQTEITLQNHDLHWLIQNTFYLPNITRIGGVEQFCHSRIQKTQKLPQKWQINPIWVRNMGQADYCGASHVSAHANQSVARYVKCTIDGLNWNTPSIYITGTFFAFAKRRFVNQFR